LAFAYGLQILGGVCDSDFRGDIIVLAYNGGDHDLEIEPKQKIAQLLLEKIAIARVKEVDKLNSTQRGTSGFGSSGF
jgi:deoxyuridine 5'-triphosphate nucleotidohydrolase